MFILFLSSHSCPRRVLSPPPGPAFGRICEIFDSPSGDLRPFQDLRPTGVFGPYGHLDLRVFRFRPKQSLPEKPLRCHPSSIPQWHSAPQGSSALRDLRHMGTFDVCLSLEYYTGALVLQVNKPPSSRQQDVCNSNKNIDRNYLLQHSLHHTAITI